MYIFTNKKRVCTRFFINIKLVIGNKNNLFIIKFLKVSVLYEKYTPIKDVIGNEKNITWLNNFDKSGEVSATFPHKMKLLLELHLVQLLSM